MRARDMLNRLRESADWIDPEKTVDRIIYGDPEKDVRRCIVTWISGMEACRAAADGGFDCIVTHEPTFYEHFDDKPSEDDACSQEKARFLDAHGITVLRCHDVWDLFPDVGIPWAWAEHLELDGPPAAISENRYQHRYDIAPVALDVFAAHVASRTALLGEPAVQTVGDPDMRVSRIGVGTGCGCNIGVFREMGCDCSIVCDDGSCYWRGIRQARDAGHAVIRVNHGTSEEPGMATLARHIDETMDGVAATHLPHGSAFRIVAGG